MKYVLLLMFVNYIKTYDLQHGGGFLTGYVVGGVDVPISMYPHMAQIIHKRQTCAGAIVSNRVILTAAHCLYSNGYMVNPNKLTVYLGSDLRKKGKKYRVCKIVPHQKYRGTSIKNFYFYDIGLILLSEKIKFSPFVRKIKIAKNEDFRNEKYAFTVTGFGDVTNLFPTRPTNGLKAARLYYVNSKLCNESQSFRDRMDVPNHMFCLIGPRWTGDCYGDSGSGVIWRRLLVGIVSTGRDAFCGSDILPSMYTNVVYFQKWIKSKIKQLESRKGCYRFE